MKGTTRQADVTTGLDLGDKRSQAVVLDASGEEIEDRSIATTRDAFERATAEYYAPLSHRRSTGTTMRASGGRWPAGEM